MAAKTRPLGRYSRRCRCRWGAMSCRCGEQVRPFWTRIRPDPTLTPQKVHPFPLRLTFTHVRGSELEIRAKGRSEMSTFLKCGFAETISLVMELNAVETVFRSLLCFFSDVVVVWPYFGEVDVAFRGRRHIGAFQSLWGMGIVWRLWTVKRWWWNVRGGGRSGGFGWVCCSCGKIVILIVAIFVLRNCRVFGVFWLWPGKDTWSLPLICENNYKSCLILRIISMHITWLRMNSLNLLYYTSNGNYT